MLKHFRFLLSAKLLAGVRFPGGVKLWITLLTLGFVGWALAGLFQLHPAATAAQGSAAPPAAAAEVAPQAFASPAPPALPAPPPL